MAANVNEARFSSNFEDEVVVTTTSADPLSTSTSDTNATAASLASPTNPFSAVEPEPAKDELSPSNSNGFTDHFDQVLELNQNDPSFNFGSNLETADSMSSLEHVGVIDAMPTTDADTGAEPVSQLELALAEPSDSQGPAEVTTSTGSQVPEPAVGNGVSGTVEVEVTPTSPTKEQEKKTWEKFEEVPVAKSKKLLASAAEGGGGAVCAADAIVSDSSQWTALGDSRGLVEYGAESESNLPFRKTQSMRATATRRIQIVDHLKQRRLSNSSLDREPYKGTQFKDEDDLTRTFKLDKEFQVFVKMGKRVRGSRTNWLPVNIGVKEGILVVKQSAPPSMPISSETVVRPDALPLHEIRLYHNHTLTAPSTRKYDKKSKIHQIKLQHTQIQERRTLRRWFLMEHISKLRTVVKLGSPDVTVIQSLADTLQEAVRQLPVTRDQGVAYRVNEVFVDVKDYSDILMNCDGAVLERKSLNRIYVQAFLSDTPECKLILNDIEAILLQGKGQMTNSMSRQVRLNDVVLHPCVDKALYKKSREIKFRPVDGYPFELLRCAIDPYVSPPVNVTALMEYSEQRSTVKITSSFSVRKKHNYKLRPIKDMVIKFPVPASWSPLFQAETVFGGTKSVRSTSSLRGSFRRKIKSSSCQIATQLGSAKYEAEHGSILWRIGQYVEQDVPHTLRVDIQLKEGMHKPDITSEHAEVSYTLPGSSTGLQIRAFKVDKVVPERWVKYEIQYRYRVQMFPDLSID